MQENRQWKTAGSKVNFERGKKEPPNSPLMVLILDNTSLIIHGVNADVIIQCLKFSIKVLNDMKV